MRPIGSIARNAGWNLLGSLAPLLTAALAVPFLVSRLGVERFGLLSLVWLLLGYFSVFDLGLGRAITQRVARLSPERDAALIRSHGATGVALAALLGVVGAVAVATAAQVGASAFVDPSAAYADEFGVALRWVALAIPFVVMTSAFRGVLEGFSRFRLLNTLRIPAGVLLLAAPCAAVAFAPRLDVATLAIVLTRLAILVAHGLATRRLVHWSATDVRRSTARSLFRFGGWLTLSNIVGPMILFADRFVVGGLLSPAMLAYHAASFEVVTRLLVFPVALNAAAFPALSSAHARQDAAHRRQQRQLRGQALRLTLAVTLPIVAVGMLAAGPLLRFWLGEAFERHGTLPMRLLLAGFLFAALAQVPETVIYGAGHSRQVALLHLAELPCHLLLLCVATSAWGLVGAAGAWALRNLVDWVALSFLAQRLVSRDEGTTEPDAPAAAPTRAAE